MYNNGLNTNTAMYGSKVLYGPYKNTRGVMSIKILVAFSNRLLSEGLGRMLEGGEVPVSVSILEDDNPQEKISSVRPDIIIVDLLTLYNVFGAFNDDERDLSFILFDTDCGEGNINSAINERGVRGVVRGDATLRTLSEAIIAVSTGNNWFYKTEDRLSIPTDVV